jgi:hypothetical protein
MDAVSKARLQPVMKPHKYTCGEILDVAWLGTTLAGVWGSVIGVLVSIVFFRG